MSDEGVTLHEMWRVLVDIRTRLDAVERRLDELTRLDVRLSEHREHQTRRTLARDQRCQSNEAVIDALRGNVDELRLTVAARTGARTEGRRLVALWIALGSLGGTAVGVITTLLT